MADVRIAAEQRQEVLARVSAPRPTTSGNGRNGRDRRAPARFRPGDDAETLAIFLPERKRLALGQRDLQPIGIKLLDRGIGDPWIGHQPRARVGDIEEKQRRLAGHAGPSEDVLAVEVLVAGQSDAEVN